MITLNPDDTNIVPGGNYMYSLKLNYYKDGLIYYFSTDSRHRYYSDGDLFHLEQARELEKILLEA